MTVKQLRKAAYSQYKTHPTNSWVIAIMLTFVFAALTLFNLLGSAFTAVIFCFIVIPLTFSFLLLHRSLKANSSISWKKITQGMRYYFSPIYFGCFRVIISFLKTLLCTLIFSIPLTIVMYYSRTSNPQFVSSLEELFNALKQESLTLEEFNAILEANDNLLLKFFYSICIPDSLVSIIFLFYFISKESLSINVRGQFLKYLNVPCSQVFANGMREHYGEYFIKYFGLNFPIYILLIIGLIAGTLISYNISGNFTWCIVIGESSAFILATLFMPFYLNNMELIGWEFEKYFDKVGYDMTIERLNNGLKGKTLNEEQQKIVDSFRQDIYDRHASHKDEDDNKKDPKGS